MFFVTLNVNKLNAPLDDDEKKVLQEKNWQITRIWGPGAGQKISLFQLSQDIEKSPEDLGLRINRMYHAKNALDLKSITASTDPSTHVLEKIVHEDANFVILHIDPTGPVNCYWLTEAREIISKIK